MKINWHQRAARVAAQNPHWDWSKVCAEVAKGRRTKVKPTVAAYVKKMEQMKLF